MLYVSALSGSKRRKNREEDLDVAPILFEAANSGDLGKLCRCLLLERERGARFAASLYTDGKCYRLILLPQNTCRSRVIRLFREFGAAICDELIAAYTAEHFRVIAAEGGADIGAKVF